MKHTITIVGGCGHVGLPLGLAFAKKGFSVFLLDVNPEAVAKVNQGIMPFKEEGAQETLEQHMGKNLNATSDPQCLAESNSVIFVTGTPIDEYHHPRIQDVVQVIQSYLPLLKPEHLIILRSTVYPGVVSVIDDLLSSKWSGRKLAFCPERIIQGKGLQEIAALPQIVSATTPQAVQEAAALFSHIAPKIIHLEPKEAELAKLMANAWRYLEFSIANQFYTMVEAQGIDFYKIYEALKSDYPRAQHFPKPGLAAGPCLFKDTMQLSAFHKGNFFLGHAAMLVNEGLPNFLIEQLEKKVGPLKHKTIGLLGMTFKADNDDIRQSLSFKIKKILEFHMAQVLIHDPYLECPLSVDDILDQADALILATPHQEYRQLRPSVPFVDCWNLWR